MVLGALGSLLYPYIIPMLLGRTFDLYRAQVGVDIFSQDVISKPIRIHRSYVTSDFRLIRNDSEARSFLGVSEDVSLRVKAGVLEIGAWGDYLKDVQKRENYVEILVKSTYQTFTETLHGSNDPIKDWENLGPDYLGTHFVRSITYGGLLLASFRMYVKDTAQKSSLEHFLASHFSVNEVRVSLKRSPDEVHFVREMNSFEEKLQKMMYDVNSKMGSDLSLRIKYYSTVTAPRVPQDLPSFLSVLEDFPFQAKKTNGGFGVPIVVELIPLHELSARMLALKPSALFGGFLGDLEEKFDDLLLTHKSLKALSDQGVVDDYGKNCQLRDLGMEVHDKMDVFRQVINHLNTASPDALGESERAIQAYQQKPSPDSYYTQFKLLEKEMKHPRTPNDRGISPDTAVGKTLESEQLVRQFGDLAELAMANGLCSSMNKLSGSFITMRRNCSSADPTPRTCRHVCAQLQIGSDYRSRAECAGVVAAQLHTPVSLRTGGDGGGVQGVGGVGQAVGAQTAHLGRSACDRAACYREYCCCRLARFSNTLL